MRHCTPQFEIRTTEELYLSIMTVNYDVHNSNVSQDNISYVAGDILWRLNSEKVLQLLPVIIFICITVVVGIVGNSLVCYIYSFRLRRSPSRYFILFLAVLDLISCLVGAGSELSDLFQPYVFTATWSCKILRFGLSFTIISASFTLICVAFDRYYKVCKPLKAFPVRKVKILCIVVGILSVLLSSPALMIFGLKTVKTDYVAITGTECSTDDGVRKTPIPVVYYIILFSAFLVLLVSFVLLYIKIGLEIWKRKKLTIGETLPALIREIKDMNCSKLSKTESIQADEASSRSIPTDDESRGPSEARTGYENQGISETDSCLQPINRTDSVKSQRINRSDSFKSQRVNRSDSVKSKRFSRTDSVKSQSESSQRPSRQKPVLKRRRSTLGRMSIRTLRTTTIFFTVSAAFVLSFLPYLIANILKFTKVAFYEFQNSAEEVTYNFCVRSYFISNCINPIIYSALNVKFRKECKKLVKRIFQQVKSCCMCQHQ